VFESIISSHLVSSQTAHAPYGSRLAAVLAPCLVALVTVVLVVLALALAELRERRRTARGFARRRLEGRDHAGERSPAAAAGAVSLSTLAARVERLV